MKHFPWLRTRFHELVEKHTQQIIIRNNKAWALCPFHTETTASCSIDFEKCIFHCFGCGASGGVKDFALLVGEPWERASLTQREKVQAAVSIRRREAESKALAILRQRKEKRLDELYAEWREVDRDAVKTAKILGFFYHRPGVAEKFPTLALRAERNYGAAIHRRVLLEAQIDGEVV